MNSAKNGVNNRLPPVLLTLVLLGLGYCSGCAHLATSAQSHELTIADVKRLTAHVSTRDGAGQKIEFSGITTAVDPLVGFAIVQDATAGIRIAPRVTPEVSLIGHRVVVRGQLSGDGQSGALSDTTIQDMGPGKMPEPLLLDQPNRPGTQVKQLGR